MLKAIGVIIMIAGLLWVYLGRNVAARLKNREFSEKELLISKIIGLIVVIIGAAIILLLEI